LSQAAGQKADGTACAALDAAQAWLDTYFAGRMPDFTPPLHLAGTVFQRTVWDLLLQIPYGTVTTYGDLAHRIAARNGIARMSAQAAGGAVGRNPVPIIVPCHRVVGADGSLTGYAGGLDRKARLLELEGVDMRRLWSEQDDRFRQS
ncbi:MAG: methylated-DNA--[Oscillibacter sp.]|nr:methylated-DNA--[protein]-cysteine S-methyltransferase [Oscillibacter sp.]